MKMRNAANANAESAAKYRQEAIKTAGGTKTGEALTDLGVAGAQMYIDALTGSALGKGANLIRGAAATSGAPTLANTLGYSVEKATGSGILPMMARSFGYGAQEAADAGFGANGQVLNGIKSAGVEYLSEKLFGGNPVYDADAGLVNKLLGKVLSEDSPIIKALASEPADIVYEGLEEVVSDMLNPLIDQGALWVTGDDRIQVDWPKAEELLKDFAIGSALSAASNFMSGNRETRELRQDLLSLDEGVDASIERLAQITGDNSETLRNIVKSVWQDEQRLTNNLAAYFASEPGVTAETAATAAQTAAELFYSGLAATQAASQQAAQEAAQQANQPTDAGIAPNAENAPSGVFNTAQDAQETKPTQTVADIYANRATRQQNIDNAAQAAYTDSSNNTVTGGMTDDAGRSAETNRDGVSGVYTGRDADYQGQREPTGTSVNSGFVLLSQGAQEILKSRGVDFAEANDATANSAAFSVSLDNARASDPQNGWAVTPKSAQEIEENGVRVFMDETGAYGFGIAPDGDIEAVFSNKSAGAPKGITMVTIPQAIANGGVKLDCYGAGLVRLYGKHGFVPVARVAFNPEYANDGWDASKGTPYIYFMMATDTDADSVVANYGQYKVWSQAELDALPLMEYDEAYAYRDSLLEQAQNKRNANAATEADARYTTAADGRDMDEGSLFDATKGPGAGATRQGPQVPSQNNLTRDMSLSEEGRAAIAESTPTHEQISDTLARTRAEAQIIRDADGNWVNLQDSIDDLRAYVSEHGVLTPEQVKLAQNVARELDAQARESGDFSELRAFNNAVISATKTNSAQSLHAWREFSGSSVDVTTTALDILDNAPLRKGVDVNEVASRVSSYSDRAQQLFDADDISGLQALVTEISTERGYKPSRSIQKIINEQANAEQLYAMAQQLSVALAVDQIKPGIGQKLSTWQTLSHLLNSRTIIRNVVSNTLFSPVDRIANNVGMAPDFVFAMVRSAAGKGSVQQNRTVGYQPNMFAPTPGGKQVRQTRKEYIQQARLKNALDVNLDGERSKNPNKPDRVVNRTFKRKGTSGEVLVNKAWNRYNNIREGVLGYGLNVTDAWQKGKTKGQSEVAMGRLRSKDGSIVSEAVSERITNDDMLYRSFQRDTALGDLLGDLREFANRAGVGKRVGKGGKSHEYGLGSMLSAYTQVPGALVHTEADYTPLGVLNTAGELYNAIRYGNAPADGVVEGGKYDGMTNADASVVAQHNASVSLARAGIGGGIMALFGWLARAGIVAFQPYGGDDKDKDETNAAQGKGGLQFNQSAFVRALQGKDTTWQDGDIIHDLSQYPPLSTIAEIGVILADEENDDKFVSILTATAMGIAEQFGDLSMMNTVRTIYDDIQYAGDKNAVEIGADIAGDITADSVSGLIPGTIRQIAKVLDGTMRDTNADTVQERVWNRFRSVMPGLRQTLPAKVDYKGEERQYAGNALTRGLNTFLLPGDVTIYQQDEVVDYIDKVAEETGKSLYAAAYAPKSFTVTDADGNEQTVTLDTDARRAYNEEYKSGYYAALEGLKSSDYADKLSYEQVAEIGRELRSLAADSAKRLYCEQNGIEYSSSYDKYQSIEDPALYLAMKESLKQLRSSNGADSEAFNSVYKQWKGLSTNEKEKYTEGIDGEFSGIDTLKKLDACIRGGLSTEQFYKAKNAHDEINEDESLNASEKRAQFANWLDTKSRFTTAQKRTALSNFPYTTTLVADEGNYEKLTAAGVSRDGGMRLFNAMQELKPAEGYDDVANWQKCEAVTGSSLSDEEQLAALSVYATDSSYSYYQAAYDCGIAPSKWSDVLANIRGYAGQTKSNGKDTYGTDISQEGLCRAMFDAGLSDAQAEAMYNVYRAARSWTKTYWKAMGEVNWSRLGYKTR